MALIDKIDAPNRLIYLSENTKNSSINPIDIYKEMRTLRRNDEELRKFDIFIKSYGNVPKGGGKYTERYIVLQQGTKIVPYNESHYLTITGTILTDDGQEGIFCFNRDVLDDNVTVDLNYIPPQVEVIVVDNGSGGSGGTSGGLTTDEHNQLMSLSSKEDIATEVWKNTSSTILTDILSKVVDIYNMNFGNWIIDNNQMIFYDLDNNEIARFNLLDKRERPTEQEVYKRLKVAN